jgi:hypothetical protein
MNDETDEKVIPLELVNSEPRRSALLDVTHSHLGLFIRMREFDFSQGMIGPILEVNFGENLYAFQQVLETYRLRSGHQNPDHAIMLVENSVWLNSLSSVPNCEFDLTEAQHYVVVTIDDYFDVIAGTPPVVKWVQHDSGSIQV